MTAQIRGFSFYTFNAEEKTVNAFFSQVNNNGLEIDNQTLHLNDDLTPSHFTWIEFKPKTGGTLSVNIAENGFTVKMGKAIEICSNTYDLQGTIKKMAYNVIKCKCDFDDQELTDAQLDSLAESMEK